MQTCTGEIDQQLRVCSALTKDPNSTYLIFLNEEVIMKPIALYREHTLIQLLKKNKQINCTSRVGCG